MDEIFLGGQGDPCWVAAVCGLQVGEKRLEGVERLKGRRLSVEGDPIGDGPADCVHGCLGGTRETALTAERVERVLVGSFGERNGRVFVGSTPTGDTYEFLDHGCVCVWQR